MAKVSGNRGAVYVGGAELSPSVSSLDTDLSATILDVTAFGATAKAKLAGLLDAKVTLKGFYDDASPSGLDTVLAPLVGQSQVSSFYPGGDAAGAPGRGGQAELLENYKLSSAVAGVVTAQADFALSGGLDRLVSVQPKAALTGSGAAQDGAAVDAGASSPNGGRAYFHLLALDAATTVAPLVVQHSADNTTYVDLATSTLAGTAPGGDSVAVAGTIQRYVRRRVTITNAKNATLQVGLARA